MIVQRANRPLNRLLYRALALAAVMVVAVGCESAQGSPVEDSTAVLQAKFDAMKPGDTLKLDKTLYKHSGVLKLRVPNVHIDGNGATLSSTNDETSSVQISADKVSLSNVTLAAPTDGERWHALDQHKLVLTGNGDSVTGVNVVGSAGAGIFVYGATNFTIDDVSVTGSRADGIHMTLGSNHGVVKNVRTDQTGDDAVAVVSYASDPAPSGDIQISDVKVGSTRWGRGISVVGGHDVTINNFTVSNTNSAGLYIASEGDPYFTDSIDSVTATNGTITGANTNPDIVQGAVLVSAGNAGKHVQNVQISGVKIAGTPESAGRNVAIVLNGGSVEGISLNDISIDSDLPALSSDADPSAYTTSGWTQGGQPITPVG